MGTDLPNDGAADDENPYRSPSDDAISNIAAWRVRWQDPLCLAAAMTIGGGAQLAMSRGHEASLLSFQLVAIGFSLDLCAGALAGIGFYALGRALVRGEFSALMPGHWLAIAQVTSVVGIACAWGVESNGPSEWGGSAADAQTIVSSITTNVVGFAFFATMGIVSRESFAWRCYAWLSALLFLGYFLGQPFDSTGALPLPYSTPLSPVASAALTLTLLGLWGARCAFAVGIALDVRRSVRRDLAHWFGIGLGTTHALAAFLIRIYVGILYG